MPKKKKTETEPEIKSEAVEGKIEGLTYDSVEQQIRMEAREKAIAQNDNRLYGTTRLSQLTGSVLKNRAMNSGVREREYSCGAELAGWVDGYFHYVFTQQEAGSELIADVEALADYLGITRDTLIRWARGDDNREFVPPLQLAMNEIALMKKQIAITGKVNSLIYLSDMQNNHGYLSNQKSSEVSLNVRLKHELPSIEQLNRQMALLDQK